MAIIQISKIQQRSGNIVDLPQLDEAEFGWATDVKRLYIGKTSPNENIEVLTSYSNISFSQINGSYGNLNIDSANIANGQSLVYTGTEWTNRGGNIGGLIDLGDVANVKIEGGALSYVLETDGTGNLSWAPKTTIIAFIENVTQDSPGVVTTTQDNYFVNGAQITITNVPGMTELNGNSYYVKVGASADTFSLYSDALLSTPVDTSGYSPFPYTPVTATTTGTNRVTVGDSALFGTNDPVVFVGSTFGGIVEGTTYYVLTTPTYDTITISETLGGPVLPLLTESGLCNVYTTGGRAVSLVSGGSGTGAGIAGGTNTMVQFNNTNVLDGSSDFTFNFGTSPKILTLNGNANVGNLNATTSVTASRLISNVSIGTAPITVTSTTRVANLNVASAGTADVAGTVTTAAQPNITSVGTLTSLDVNGLIASTRYSSNVGTGLAPLIVTSTTRVGNLSVDYANVSDFGVVTLQTSGTYYPAFVSSSATGNRALGANANLAFNAGTGNLATNILYANGNITGGNISTGGVLSVTGNITGANFSGNNVISNSVFASRTIQSAYAIVEPQRIINKGTGFLTSITTAVATGSTPYSVAIDPFGKFVYVTNNDNTVSQYSINQSTGALAVITAAIASQSAPRGIAVDPTSRFVYVVNAVSGSVSQYSINQSTGALTSITAAIATGSSPSQIAIDPTGRFVYVTNFSGNTVSQYSINQTTGELTSITTAIATGTNPYGITVDPTGRFVYVVNNSSGTVSQYSINQSTGALTSITTAIATGTLPRSVVVDPSGRFVYVTNYGTNAATSTVSQYSINQSTGALTSITTAISPNGTFPNGIAVDPAGRFIYVTIVNSSQIRQLIINQSTGSLSLGGNFSVGSLPEAVAVDATGRFLFSVNRSESTVSQFSISNFSTGSITAAGTITSSGTISGSALSGNITSLTTGAVATAGTITGNWTLTSGSRLNATYADLAEYYNADQNYEPGTVLEFGGDNEVTIATVGTARVAGVVSTDPAYAMNATCPGEHPVALALQGRVPTKVTGSIRKGDMMVSAGDGYATACSSPVLGTVIGKSLENFDGTGVIEIVVGRL